MSKKTLEQLKAEAEVAAEALKEAIEAERQAAREAKEAEEKAKALLKAKETQSTKIQILTQMHKVLVTTFKDAILEAPEVTDPYRNKEPNITLSPGANYPYLSVQARKTGDVLHPHFLGWGIALTLESFGKTRVYPSLSNGGYSYDKIVKVIKEHLEIKAAAERRKVEDSIRKTRKTDLASGIKKELGLKEDSVLVQGVLEQGYRDYRGRWCPRSYEASDGHVWLNLGSRQCTPEQVKIMINAMRLAGFEIK